MVKLEFGVTNIKYPKKDISTGEVAVILEYGTDEIPPVPAFKMGLDKSVKDNKKLIDATLRNAVNHMLTGRKDSLKRNLTQALTQVGRSAKKNTKDLIKSVNLKHGNAQSTIDRKGFDNRDWETGLLHDSVEYLVSEE